MASSAFFPFPFWRRDSLAMTNRLVMMSQNLAILDAVPAACVVTMAISKQAREHGCHSLGLRHWVCMARKWHLFGLDCGFVKCWTMDDRLP